MQFRVGEGYVIQSHLEENKQEDYVIPNSIRREGNVVQNSVRRKDK